MDFRSSVRKGEEEAETRRNRRGRGGKQRLVLLAPPYPRIPAAFGHVLLIMIKNTEFPAAEARISLVNDVHVTRFAGNSV